MTSHLNEKKYIIPDLTRTSRISLCHLNITLYAISSLSISREKLQGAYLVCHNNQYLVTNTLLCFRTKLQHTDDTVVDFTFIYK